MKQIRLAKSPSLYLWGVMALVAWSVQGAEPDLRAVAAQSLVTVSIKPVLETWEEPLSEYPGERCPNCGRVHGSSHERILGMEVPLQVSGFLFAPDRVVMADPLLRVGEMPSIMVERGGERIPAVVERICLKQDAMLLKLERPFSAKAFSAPPAGASTGCVVAVASRNAMDTLCAKTAQQTDFLQVTADGQRIVALPSIAQLLDEKGAVFGYATSMPFAEGDLSAKSAKPEDWAGLSPQELAAEEAKILTQFKKSFRPVTFGLRAPKSEAGSETTRRYSYSSRNNESANELEVSAVGVFLRPQRLLVPCDLTYEQIARLESIRVTLADGKTVEGRFVCALQAAHAVVVELPQAYPEAVAPLDGGKQGLQELQHLLSIEVVTSGEYEVRIHRTRISEITPGWRGNLTAKYLGRGNILFALNGRCSWLPLRLRRTESDEMSAYTYRSSRDPMCFLADAVAALAEPAPADVKTAWVPLSEADEGRLGWLGIDLQVMDPALAEAQKVSGATKYGKIGGLVTQVYPDSPAARAGIESNWIFTRILPEGRTLPIDVMAKDSDYSFSDRAFSWSDMDKMPLMYFDRMPAPWPPLKTNVRRYLTEHVGIGTKLTAEFWVAGKRVLKELTVEAAPESFGTSRALDWKAGGLKLGALTFEVRRYLNVDKAAPGVVVRQVRQGTSAALAGIKPYELIIAVGEKKVFTPAECLAELGELKAPVTVRISRMGQERTVVIQPMAARPANAAKEMLSGFLDDDDE